jgi:tetratricopeptide (TPR) repeat protein
MRTVNSRTLRRAAWWGAFVFMPIALAQAPPPQPAPAASTDVRDLSRPEAIPSPDLTGVEAPIRARILDAQKRVAQIDATQGSRGAAAYGSLGELYHAYGFTDAAAACYREAGILDPDEFRWHYYAALLARERGDLAEAEAGLKIALRLHPIDELPQLRLAEIVAQANRLDEAEHLYRSVLDRNASDVPALHGLGKVALARRQYAQAADYLQRALALDPGAAYLHYPLAMAYRGMGQADKAQAELNQHGPAAPALMDPYLAEIRDLKTGKSDLWIRGSEQMSAGDFAGGINTYRSLVELDPKDALAKTYLGAALARAGMTAEALRELNAAVEIAPANAEVHYCLGIVLVRVGRDADAIQHLRRALEADPHLKEAHFQLANALMRNREFTAAAEQYGYARDEDAKNGFAAVMQAMAFVRQGDYASALSVLEAAHSSMPADPDIGNALSRILAAAPEAKLRDGARAVRIMQELVAREGAADLDQAATIAMALAETGQFEKAAQIQRTIIDNLSGDAEAPQTSPLRDDLDAYEHRRPCRTPWRENDPIFVPTPGRSAEASVHPLAGPGAG